MAAWAGSFPPPQLKFEFELRTRTGVSKVKHLVGPAVFSRCFSLFPVSFSFCRAPLFAELSHRSVLVVSDCPVGSVGSTASSAVWFR